MELKTDKSSNGEMKTSLRLMICCFEMRWERHGEHKTHVLVLNMFQQLKFAISSFAEDGSAKGFHNLLYRDGGTCKLVLCRTRKRKLGRGEAKSKPSTPNETKCAWNTAWVTKRRIREKKRYPFQLAGGRHNVWWPVGDMKIKSWKTRMEKYLEGRAENAELDEGHGMWSRRRENASNYILPCRTR